MAQASQPQRDSTPAQPPPLFTIWCRKDGAGEWFPARTCQRGEAASLIQSLQATWKYRHNQYVMFPVGLTPDEVFHSVD